MADDAAAPSVHPEEAQDPAAGHQPESGATMLDTEADETDEVVGATDANTVVGQRMSHVRLTLIAGLAAVVALGGLVGWLGYRANQSRNLEQQRALFLEAGRQGAINLTTLDYEHIDTDVQRVLDSATGTFYDDFQQRAPSFAEVVKQVKSKSVGTVTAAALESDDPTQAEVLVAVTVKSVIVGQPDQRPRSWRMRILVQRVQDDAKVSNVEFRAVTEPEELTTSGAETTGEATTAIESTTAIEEPNAEVVDEAAARTGVDWSRVLAYGLLPALALVLALAAGYLKYVDNSVRESDVARTQSVQAARASTIAILSYTPDKVDQQLNDARNLLTGEFRDSYTSLINNVVIPGAKQQQISAVATVPKAGSVSAQSGHAVVLVFVNQTVAIGSGAPSSTASSVSVTLDEVGGKWLISEFTPV